MKGVKKLRYVVIVVQDVVDLQDFYKRESFKHVEGGVVRHGNAQ